MRCSAASMCSSGVAKLEPALNDRQNRNIQIVVETLETGIEFEAPLETLNLSQIGRKEQGRFAW